MAKQIQVSLAEVKKVFLLLEELNSFFHDPDKYGNQERLINYVERGMCDQVHEAYYHTVWNWLPAETQKEIENRPSSFEAQSDNGL